MVTKEQQSIPATHTQLHTFYPHSERITVSQILFHSTQRCKEIHFAREDSDTDTEINTSIVSSKTPAPITLQKSAKLMERCRRLNSVVRRWSKRCPTNKNFTVYSVPLQTKGGIMPPSHCLIDAQVASHTSRAQVWPNANHVGQASLKLVRCEVR